MTAPIQEPSSARDQSGTAWAMRQLARRPAPSALCPCPVEFAFVQGISTASAADDTPTLVSWVDYAISPGATNIAINTASRPFQLKTHGFYQFWLDFEWNASGFTDVRTYFLDWTGGGFFDNEDSTYPPRATGSDPYFSGITASFGPLHASPTMNVGLKAWQKSTASKDINTGFFTVTYLGPGLGIDDGITTWPSLITAF